MSFTATYNTYFILLAVVGVLGIITSNKLMAVIIPLYLNIHRYNIYIPSFDHSIQLGHIALAAALLKLVIQSLWVYRERIFYILYKQLKSNPLTIWIILLVSSAVIHSNSNSNLYSYIWGILLISFAMTALLIGYNIHHHKYLYVGLTLSVLVNTILSVWQLIDCRQNSCLMFKYIENAAHIKALPIGHQHIVIGKTVYQRYMGTFGDTNLLAFAMYAVIPILLYLHNKLPKSKIRNIDSTIIIILALATGFFTLSRSAIIGLLVSLATIFIVYIKHIVRYIWKHKIVLLLLLLISSGSIFLLSHAIHNSTVQAYIQSQLMPKNNPSSKEHFLLIKEAYNIAINDTNLLGCGIGNYYNYYNLHYNLKNFSRDPHSYIARTFAEQGLIGITISISFIVYILYKVLHTNNQPHKTHVITATPIILFTGFIIYYGLYIPFFWFLIGITLQLFDCHQSYHST